MWNKNKKNDLKIVKEGAFILECWDGANVESINLRTATQIAVDSDCQSFLLLSFKFIYL